MNRRVNRHSGLTVGSAANAASRSSSGNGFGRKADSTREEAKQNVFDYIEMFYNPKRRHSFSNDLSPVEYEKQHVQRLSRV